VYHGAGLGYWKLGTRNAERPVPLVSTPAIVLATFRYGETSKIVRLATRDHGVQSVIAKGALRPRSRFGAALQVLSSGQAQLILSERRDLHLLTAFDLAVLPVRIARDVGRYATATVLAEVTIHFAPAEPHQESYTVLERALARLQTVSPEELDAASLQVVWRLVGALGFAPALQACVRDGRPIGGQGGLPFSAPEGGALCPVCARGADTTLLPEDARRALALLLSDEDTVPELDARNAAAHRRLVARYIRYHMAEGAVLPALEFWVARAWSVG
jgi:DNA repair protein RecO (recombination protein O)